MHAARLGGQLLELAGVVKRKGEPSASIFELEVPYFSVHPREFVAVVGESGCGKSTLLDMLGLVSRPSAMERFVFAGAQGEVDVVDLWETNDERGLATVRASEIGYVLQTGGLLPFLTVRQNAALPFRIRGMPVDYERVTNLAVRLGIAKQLDQKPAKLSGGERQRAAILRAGAHRPRLMLADEPTAAVDKTRAVEIVSDFARVARDSGVAVIMVTHDLGLVERLADRMFTFEVEGIGDREVRSRAYEIASQQHLVASGP